MSRALIISISTMAVRQKSTRTSSSLDDFPVSLSSVYFEQWELRTASRNHRFIGNSAFFAADVLNAKESQIPTNVLTCWEVNMGFTERGNISTGFNDIDSWNELVTPCCHCVTFKQDRPLKKKLLTFSSHHDIDIAKRYK